MTEEDLALRARSIVQKLLSFIVLWSQQGLDPVKLEYDPCCRKAGS